MNKSRSLMLVFGLALVSAGTVSAATVDVDLVVTHLFDPAHRPQDRLTLNVSGAANTNVGLSPYITTTTVGWHYGASSVSLGHLINSPAFPGAGSCYNWDPVVIGGVLSFALFWQGDGVPWSTTTDRRFVGYYRSDIVLYNQTTHAIVASDFTNVPCYP
jgi:hypothetical protein